MRLNRVTPLVLMCCCLELACTSRIARPRAAVAFCGTAGSRVHQAWQNLSAAVQTPGGCDPDNGLRCDTIRAEMERLSVECPYSPDVVMANALLAFEDHNPARAQQLLDELSALGVSNPEAASLRIRIAIEEGNIPFALRFAEQQIRHMGDDAGLRETYASALYFAGRWEETRTQLAAAQELGAPAWRVGYAQGLVAESEGKFDEAKQRYQEALKSRPEWRQAESRLRALIATGKVSR